MYAICVEYSEKYGVVVPSGNNGMQKLYNKTRRGWVSETECMRKRTTGNVYIVANFTQKMCEMTSSQLAIHVQNNSITVL